VRDENDQINHMPKVIAEKSDVAGVVVKIIGSTPGIVPKR
jgi:hypothetical protein